MKNSVLVGRLLFGLVVFGGWELYGRLVDATWTSMPSLVIQRLFEMNPAHIMGNVGTTLYEMGVGLLIGSPCAVLLGLTLGRMPRTAALLQPFIIAGNTIPLPALAPLLIMWFGLGVSSKIALVALVTFFLMFFPTLAGSRSVDRDQIEMLTLMGGSRREVLRKIIAPASIVWIFAGLKNAIPYSLIAATVGEILLSRAGVGSMIARAAEQFDMTGIYTALFILMLLGGTLNLLLARTQRYVLRWRD